MAKARTRYVDLWWFFPSWYWHAVFSRMQLLMVDFITFFSFGTFLEFSTKDEKIELRKFFFFFETNKFGIACSCEFQHHFWKNLQVCHRPKGKYCHCADVNQTKRQWKIKQVISIHTPQTCLWLKHFVMYEKVKWQMKSNLLIFFGGKSHQQMLQENNYQDFYENHVFLNFNYFTWFYKTKCFWFNDYTRQRVFEF